MLFAALLRNVDATGDSSADQVALGCLLVLFIIPGYVVMVWMCVEPFFKKDEQDSAADGDAHDAQQPGDEFDFVANPLHGSAAGATNAAIGGGDVELTAIDVVGVASTSLETLVEVGDHDGQRNLRADAEAGGSWAGSAGGGGSEDQGAAANHIGRVARGALVRRRSRSLKAERAQLAAEEQAAMHIGRIVRGHAGRRQSRSLKVEGAAQPELASLLLPGWVEVVTEDGRQYYHNTASDETSWERPIAVGTEVGLAQEDAPSSILI